MLLRQRQQIPRAHWLVSLGSLAGPSSQQETPVHFSKKVGVGEVVQAREVKGLAAMPDHQSLIPRTHLVGTEKIPKVVLWLPCVRTAHIQTINKCTTK